jgi:hypothetical protein
MKTRRGSLVVSKDMKAFMETDYKRVFDDCQRSVALVEAALKDHKEKTKWGGIDYGNVNTLKQAKAQLDNVVQLLKG